MKLTKEKQSTKKQLWNSPKVITMSAKEISSKVIASACSEYLLDCSRRYFR